EQDDDLSGESFEWSAIVGCLVHGSLQSPTTGMKRVLDGQPSHRAPAWARCRSFSHGGTATQGRGCTGHLFAMYRPRGLHPSSAGLSGVLAFSPRRITRVSLSPP